LSRPPSPSSTLESLGLPAEPGSIYELALTHRSFAFEQPRPIAHNERLEFLGDAILGAVVTDLIYRSHPDLTEGQMARLRASVVNTHALARLARELGIGDYLRLGRGEGASGGREKASLLADTFEALVGAAYLDKGLEELTRALVPVFSARLVDQVAAGGGSDAKTSLQETAIRLLGARPSYRIQSSGPDHEKVFTAAVYVHDEPYGTGSGHSKKEAEQNAAREALRRVDPSSSYPEGTSDAHAC
jgi:ribonuclease III